MKTRLDDLASLPLRSRMWGRILILSLFPPPHSSWKTDQRESEQESVESFFWGISPFAGHCFTSKGPGHEGKNKLARHLLKTQVPSVPCANEYPVWQYDWFRKVPRSIEVGSFYWFLLLALLGLGCCSGVSSSMWRAEAPLWSRRPASHCIAFSSRSSGP